MENLILHRQNLIHEVTLITRKVYNDIVEIPYFERENESLYVVNLPSVTSHESPEGLRQDLNVPSCLSCRRRVLISS